jgi:hypothetical protein
VLALRSTESTMRGDTYAPPELSEPAMTKTLL